MTRHAILQAARAHEPCTVCRAEPGHPCDCGGAVHLCRIARAAHDGHITMRDATSVMQEDVFAGWSLVHGEVAT